MVPLDYISAGCGHRIDLHSQYAIKQKLITVIREHKRLTAEPTGTEFVSRVTRLLPFPTAFGLHMPSALETVIGYPPRN